MRNVLDRCNRCVWAPPQRDGFTREDIPLALHALLKAAVAPGAAQQAPTAYFYAIGLTQAAEQAPLLVERDGDRQMHPALFALAYELHEQAQAVFGYESALFAKREFDQYEQATVRSFLGEAPGYSSGWVGWLGERKKPPITPQPETRLRMALLLSYLALRRGDALRPLYGRMLEQLGVVEITEEDWRQLTAFDLEQTEPAPGTGVAGRLRFARLTNLAAVAFTLTLYANLLMTYAAGPQERLRITQAFQAWFSASYAEPFAASEAVQDAQYLLWRATEQVDLRSVNNVRRPQRHEIFVTPAFTSLGRPCASPFAQFAHRDYSRRCLLTAQTGLGKTTLVEMGVHCLLADRFADPTQRAQYAPFQQELAVPEDLVVLYVKARSFSLCYQDADPERRAWCGDFVDLFFGYTWQPSPLDYDAYRPRQEAELCQRLTRWRVTDALRAHLSALAREGRLLLILDSLDEIPRGGMRQAYLEALERFVAAYCGEGVGAHVLICCREMSPETMRQVIARAQVDERSRYAIEPLDAARQGRILQNLQQYLALTDDMLQELQHALRENHFYTEFARNPYMLTVMIFLFRNGQSIGETAETIVKTLLVKMSRQHRNSADMAVTEVLDAMGPILRDIALNLVLDNREDYSEQEVWRFVAGRVCLDEYDPAELAAARKKIRDILTIEVGVIVPADHKDQNFQFINHAIAYELAAIELRERLREGAARGALRQRLAGVSPMARYVGLLAPLLCRIHTDDAALAEQLIADLTLRDTAAAEEEALLARCIEDLLLGRYGDSAATSAHPGTVDDRSVNRAQRLLLMRLSASPAFAPDAATAAALAACPAARKHPNWHRPF
jgi:hypothetical protein